MQTEQPRRNGQPFDGLRRGMDTAKVHIPAAQEELIAALARLGKPLVTVVIAGRAYCIEKIENASDAVLYAFYPGPMGGRAVAELLYGSSNPSGRLPVSMPRHVGQIPVCYNYRTSVAPAYCDMTSQPLHTFGEGRSYTTFTGSDVSVTKKKMVFLFPLPWKIPEIWPELPFRACMCGNVPAALWQESKS